MNGIVAYSRPRGKLGPYVFTVVTNFIYPGENVHIIVTEDDNDDDDDDVEPYSCSYCGRWATIQQVTATEHRVLGTLEIDRFDNVVPGHLMEITLRDPGLLFFQRNQIHIEQHNLKMRHDCFASTAASIKKEDFPKKLYEVYLLNWDEHILEQRQQHRPMRVEEELIQKTMNGEAITIKELVLQPARQQIQGSLSFVEGELKYLE